MSFKLDVTQTPEVAQHTSPPSGRAAIEEHFISIDACRIRYLVGGSGPNLLFIHGLFGYSFSWRFNLPVLAKSYSVLAPDLPGAGFSERMAGKDCSVPALASTVIELMRTLGIRAASLVGSSHGGAVAIEVAAAAPHNGIRINKLALVSPVNPWSGHGHLLTWLAGTRVGASVFPPISKCILPFHSFFVRRMYGDTRLMAPGTCEGYAKATSVPGTAAQLVARVRHWRRDLKNASEKLSQLAMPVLLVWGGRDRAVTTSSSHEFVRRLPNGHLVMMPDAGHIPYEEQPEEFNKILLDFLTQGIPTSITPVR